LPLGSNTRYTSFFSPLGPSASKRKDDATTATSAERTKTEADAQKEKLRGSGSREHSGGGASTSGASSGAAASSRTQRRVVAGVATTLAKYDLGSRELIVAALLDKTTVAAVRPPGVHGKKEEEVRHLLFDQGFKPFLEDHCRGNTDAAREMEARALRTVASDQLETGRLVAATAR
jgi:hypothetical protein